MCVCGGGGGGGRVAGSWNWDWGMGRVINFLSPIWGKGGGGSENNSVETGWVGKILVIHMKMYPAPYLINDSSLNSKTASHTKLRHKFVNKCRVYKLLQYRGKS